VDDEHCRTASPFDPVAVVEHLHEVRTADQSAGVTQERHQDRCAAERRQIEPAAAKNGQIQRGRRVAGARR
jgi:hypothetical protein